MSRKNSTIGGSAVKQNSLKSATAKSDKKGIDGESPTKEDAGTPDMDDSNAAATQEEPKMLGAGIQNIMMKTYAGTMGTSLKVDSAFQPVQEEDEHVQTPPNHDLLNQGISHDDLEREQVISINDINQN